MLDKKYKLNISFLDKSHSDILEIGRKIITLKDIKEVLEQIKILDNYISEHFTLEEDLAKYFKYPNTIHLKNSHSEIKLIYNLIRDSIIFHLEGEGYFVREFLVQIQKDITVILTNHLEQYDMPLVQYIKQNYSQEDIKLFEENYFS
jgi:hemerythrin